jgi:hypothetical protein|tara:strand:+ start:4218 stop:5177 length:960 start_codon:yes stop_codon:yes gene_type:complete
MAIPGLSEIVTTTIQSRSGVLADNVTNNNAILQRLNTKGNIKPVSGGDVILQELDYAENGTFRRYSGYETLDVSPSQVFTSASFNYKQAAVAITISGLEELQNAGEERIIDLLEGRIRNAERTMSNNISGDMYSDGTASGSKQIGGLQLLVSDAPATPTVGGISAATWSFWRNQQTTASTAAAGSILGAMNSLYTSMCRANDTPDLILADNNYYTRYMESLQLIQRVTSNKMASAGFVSLKYMNSDVVLDGGYGGNCPQDHMYFLNTDYLYFRPHSRRNMVPIGDDRFSVNQDAMVKLIGFAGNMTVANRFLQGVLTNT